MKIKVPNIPEEGRELLFSLDGEKFLELLPGNKKTDFSLRRTEVTCFARKMRNTVSLQVAIKTAMDLECSRCLKEVTLPVQTTFGYTLVPEGSGIDEEDLSSADEDLNVGCYREDVIDLGLLVLEQIILHIPIKPLCREDCRGLCPLCGTNLNEAACGCEKNAIDPRFALLKKFKVAK